MTTLLWDYYQAAIKEAKKNLQGEELEKCLQALKNYMDKFGGQTAKLIKEPE